MPFAVTHVLLSIILIDLFRDYVIKKKKLISLFTILIGGIAGLLPDIDVPLGWIFSYFGISIIHGSITHTPFFALLFFIPGMIFFMRGHKKQSVLYFVIAFGIFFHIFLDWLLGGGMKEGVMWLYPFSIHPWNLHLLNRLNLVNIAQGLDAIILLIWLWHEEIKHKISDFI